MSPMRLLEECNQKCEINNGSSCVKGFLHIYNVRHLDFASLRCTRCFNKTRNTDCKHAAEYKIIQPEYNESNSFKRTEYKNEWKPWKTPSHALSEIQGVPMSIRMLNF